MDLKIILQIYQTDDSPVLFLVSQPLQQGSLVSSGKPPFGSTSMPGGFLECVTETSKVAWSRRIHKEVAVDRTVVSRKQTKQSFKFHLKMFLILFCFS